MDPSLAAPPGPRRLRRVPTLHACPPYARLVAQLAPAQRAVGTVTNRSWAGVGFMGRTPLLCPPVGSCEPGERHRQLGGLTFASIRPGTRLVLPDGHPGGDWSPHNGDRLPGSGLLPYPSNPPVGPFMGRHQVWLITCVCAWSGRAC